MTYINGICNIQQMCKCAQDVKIISLYLNIIHLIVYVFSFGDVFPWSCNVGVIILSTWLLFKTTSLPFVWQLPQRSQYLRSWVTAGMNIHECLLLTMGDWFSAGLLCVLSHQTYQLLWTKKMENVYFCVMIYRQWQWLFAHYSCVSDESMIKIRKTVITLYERIYCFAFVFYK